MRILSPILRYGAPLAAGIAIAAWFAGRPAADRTEAAAADAPRHETAGAKRTPPSRRADAAASGARSASSLEDVLSAYDRDSSQAARLGAAHYDTLLRAIERGDTRAARLLHDGLSRCERRPSPEEYARLRPMLADDGVPSRRALDSVMRDCGGYTPAQLASDWDVVRAGAERGDDELRVAYAGLSARSASPFDPDALARADEQRERALGYLREAAADGYADAYLALGDAYRRGELVSADPALAYAYKLAWLERLRATTPYENEVAAFAAGIAREASTLTHDDELRAGAYAQAILQGEVP